MQWLSKGSVPFLISITLAISPLTICSSSTLCWTPILLDTTCIYTIKWYNIQNMTSKQSLCWFKVIICHKYKNIPFWYQLILFFYKNRSAVLKKWPVHKVSQAIIIIGVHVFRHNAVNTEKVNHNNWCSLFPPQCSQYRKSES